MYRIGIILYYNSKDLMESMVAPYSRLFFRVARPGNVIEVANQLVNTEKVDIIITVHQFVELLSRRVTVPIIGLYSSDNDIIFSLQTALKETRSIAFVDMETANLMANVEDIQRILGCQIHYYYLSSQNSIPEIADQIIADGNDVVVSFASCLLHYLSNLSVRTLLIRLGESEIQNSIYQAEALLRQRMPAVGSTASYNSTAPPYARYTFDDIIGNSLALCSQINMAKQYADYSSSILISGESGTGKELFAQSIHNWGRYRFTPFVSLNCAAVPVNLIESELFGYEGGSFTGAAENGRQGLLELANGGTFFLDEIGDMPLDMQVKLLRTMQEKSVRRIGGKKERPIDVRIICATNRNLFRMIEAGQFREDFFYRINVLPLEIPPLRMRKGDIRVITDYYLKKISQRITAKISMKEKYYQLMEAYSWPGNIRELYNFLERFAIMSSTSEDNDTIFSKLIGDMQKWRTQENTLSGGNKMAKIEGIESTVPSRPVMQVPIGTMKEMELFIIHAVLDQCGGDKKEAAARLKLSDTTFWRRLQEKF